MPSLVAWLDASTDDQRRMREIVSMFTQSDARDELGIGQIRDALSDGLFPGTSTLIGRARYLLFVPWCFQVANEMRGDLDRARDRIDGLERDLVATLQRETDGDGLIGRTAGRNVKNLPSALYWVCLRRYGILSSPDSDRSDAIERERLRSSRMDVFEGDEHDAGGWVASLPPRPRDFPQTSGGGFDLTRAEAEWLKVKLQVAVNGTLLADLLDTAPDPSSSAPWLDQAVFAASPDAIRLLEHARRFSLVIRGAAQIYNLLVAEAYEKDGNSAVDSRVDRYLAGIDDWIREISDRRNDLADWDISEFWATVRAINPNVNPLTRRFVDDWITATRQPAFDLDAARTAIGNRERQKKGAQSRLTNPRVLAMWQGASGAGQLVYRWPQVTTLLTDIHAGLRRPDA
jgi:hypothetical protein